MAAVFFGKLPLFEVLMIIPFIPKDPVFSEYEVQLKQLYEENQTKIHDTNSFHFIVNSTLFYGFADKDGALIGAIYFFFDEEKKLFLNAYASRGHHEKNLECVKLATSWFNCDIYAEAQNRASALCLLRCGFKRLKDKTFVYKHC